MTYLWGHELSNPPRCWKRVNGCVDVGAAKWSSCLPCLIIRLIIQTIRPDRSGSVWTDGTPNVSRPDPSGAIPTDATRGCGCGLQVVTFPELAGVAQLHVGLLVGRVASSDRAAAFQLGVQLRPQQDRGV